MDPRDAQYIDYTISAINKSYKTLLAMEPTDEYPNPSLEAARFIVTGYNARENQRARLETLHYALSEDSPLPESRRDYDSLIGFTDHIPIHTDLYVHPYPLKQDNLEKKLGLKVKFYLAESKQASPCLVFLVARILTII